MTPDQFQANLDRIEHEIADLPARCVARLHEVVPAGVTA